MLKNSNQHGELSSRILSLRGVTLDDAYQAIRKIKEKVNSRSYVEIAPDDESSKIVLMGVQDYAGLLLNKVQDLECEQAVYKPVGNCTSTRKELCKNFENGEWEKATVEIT